MTAGRGLATRVSARVSALVLGVVIGATGLLPPRIRYGYVHRITGALLRRPLPVLRTLNAGPRSGSAAHVTRTGDLRCVLVGSELDIGGIGSVVELLATRLPAMGVASAVICLDDGARAQRMRDLGIEVRSVRDKASALRALEELRPDVIQLHGAPAYLEAAAHESRAPLVPVMHNTEIHYSRARWRRFSRALSESSSAVAVSELVRTFHAGHLPALLRSRIAVIPNAAPGLDAPGPQQRREARGLLERAVGGRFSDDVVFVCLARYDAQKNIAGTVASFLTCVAAGVPAQLVIAGEPSDWVELRRSEAIRRGSHDADRVHLLATSDARTLLAAADAFVLNSFFEGWPVAATEAWAAGLPLILSDFGGARELVARDPGRSVLIANGAGEANEVTDTRVEHARWRAGHQRNSSELGEAILRVVDTVHSERAMPLAPSEASDGVAAMIDAHARVLREAARSCPAGGSNRPGRLPEDQTRGTGRLAAIEGPF
ncbi:glycosyltransferase family 4 protein [Cryobacterium psychrophilum]|uniref:Glycosyltransferase n=1 Tax=Cryobacterium psychrophilum TaxID=41988 RepID=A0A4Y8KM78_9MICO|nr:glycosyltransferase family 4 protein [Cryobacterium psychrophilum]TDW29943.1 glycosyltransferase involved in cell wall biosynthesis [Cryobacterium psychrophilum]TFD76507.1 glycosyltransferase [Cryobacterium psychrophilum]